MKSEAERAREAHEFATTAMAAMQTMVEKCLATIVETVTGQGPTHALAGRICIKPFKDHGQAIVAACTRAERLLERDELQG